MARVVVKARESYERLEDFEKVQFDAFVQQRIQIAFRGFRAAEESVFLISREYRRTAGFRFKAHMTRFFITSRGVLRMLSFEILVQRDIIRDEPWLKKFHPQSFTTCKSRLGCRCLLLHHQRFS